MEHWTRKAVVPDGAPSRPGRRLISLDEASRLLGLSVASVRRLIWAGKLPRVRLTRKVQLDIKDIEWLLERSKDRAGQ